MFKLPKRNSTVKIGFVAFTVIAAGIITVWVTIFRDTSLSRLQDGGVIRIGYAIEAPYAFLTPEGKVTGESPEIASYVVPRLGIGKILWRLVDFGSLIEELEAGRIDVIAAGMYITPERASRVSFSEPTFQVRQGLLVPKGNPRHFRSYRQLVHTTGIKVAALSGSFEEKTLQRLGIHADQLISVPDALTGRVAVESGAADCLALSSLSVRWMALKSQTGQTEIAQPFDDTSIGPRGHGAFAFRKEDGRLLAAWNGVLKPYIGSQKHLDLIARFGFSPAELPVSLAEVSPK